MKVFLAGTASRKWVLYENLSGWSERQESDTFCHAHKRERERDGDAAGVADEDIPCGSVSLRNEKGSAHYSRGGYG